ncbi:hypothetical protein BGZ92_011114 [Podila epicladia]|nr:hypothetical protein BGZ92_011114 [Podila epicladia]
MPPLQQTIFDSASPIPFADNTPFSNVFDTDIFAPSSQTPPPKPYDTPLTTLAPMPTVSEPTSEDIAALFGVPPLPSITPSIPVATPAVAPPAHYSSLPHHLAQEKSPIAPIPASPTLYEPPQKTSLVVPLSLNKPHRYPSYNTYNQQEQYSEQPQHQYFEQNTQYQRNNTTNNAETYNYNVNGYSVYTTDDYSQPESGLATKPADPFMLNPSKPSIFSRFSNSNGGVGFGTTPNLAKAVSYMSSTLAVTSTFATEKLATASTKIADLWQHNQTLLPQQQHSQQLQQPSQDQYNNYYDTTINSGPYYHDNKEQPSSYETGYGPVSGANYVHSDINNHNNSTSNYSPTFGDTKQPPPYEYQPYQQQQHQQQQQQQKQQQQLYQQSTGGSFAETATSTLSNAATVATSYLPNLSKLPALKSLPALPALPWGSRNKGLPQQQPSQYQQQYQGSESYSFGQPEQQHQQPQYAQDAHQPFSNYNYSYSEQIGQGGGRLLAGTGELLQKGRQMVQTGAQAGVAWWWGADSKNSMSVV